MPGLLLQLGVGYTHSNFDEFDSEIAVTSAATIAERAAAQPHVLARYEWAAFGGTLAVQADAKYNDDQYFSVNNDPVLAQDAYSVINARVGYTAASGRFGVALWGRNLGDEQYATGAYDLAAFGFDQLIVGDPRSYGLTLSYRLR